MQNEEIDLRSIIRIIKHRFAWILLTGVLCGSGSYAAARYLVTPLYTAKASMYVFSDMNRNADSSAITSSELSTSQKLVSTYIVILKSNTVLSRIIDNLGLNCTVDELRDMIAASSLDNTEAFSVSITNENPEIAAAIANEIVEVAPKEIIRVVKAGGVEVIDYAAVPVVPASPNIERFTALGALLGLFISFAGFVLYEMYNTTIRNEEDLERFFTTPVLGSIPKLIDSTSEPLQKELKPNG